MKYNTDAACAIDDVNVIDVLEKGLDDLASTCHVVLEKFQEARKEMPERRE